MFMLDSGIDDVVEDLRNALYTLSIWDWLRMDGEGGEPSVIQSCSATSPSI